MRQYEYRTPGELLTIPQFENQAAWDGNNCIWSLCSCFVLPERKRRLFIVACCRHIMGYIPPSFHCGIEVAEQFADGLVSESVRRTTFHQLSQLELSRRRAIRRESPRIANACYVARACLYIYPDIASLSDYCALVNHRNMFQKERLWQIQLLRSMIKPFTPTPNYHYNSTTTQLAEAVYDRDLQAVAPLHDALLDQGYADLAEEYKSTEFIYKGHWATDVILKRTV